MPRTMREKPPIFLPLAFNSRCVFPFPGKRQLLCDGLSLKDEAARCCSSLADVAVCLYDGYGHAAYDTAPDYKKRLLQFFAPDSAE